MFECAYCGIDCKKCECASKFNCPGCQACNGKMFWGECPIALCVIEKQIKHCGECSEFPCDLLNGFAYDEDQGDNGKRIRNIERIMNEEKV